MADDAVVGLLGIVVRVRTIEATYVPVTLWRHDRGPG